MGTSLGTMSDTLSNAQGISAGLVDMDRVPTLESGGTQFAGDDLAIIYLGTSSQNLIQHAFNRTTVFVPKTSASLTIDADAFEYSGSASGKLYVKGPQATSPTTIAGSANIPPTSLAYYLEVSATTDGNGSIAKASGGFLADAIEAREVLEGNLTSGNSYAEESQALTYTITPNTNYVVKEIEATDSNGTTDITTACTDNGDGTWTFPGVSEDTSFYVIFENPPIVTYDDTNSTGNTYTDPTTLPVATPSPYLTTVIRLFRASRSRPVAYSLIGILRQTIPVRYMKRETPSISQLPQHSMRSMDFIE